MNDAVVSSWSLAFAAGAYAIVTAITKQATDSTISHWKRAPGVFRYR